MKLENKNIMTRERRFEVLELSKIWSGEFPDLSIEDTFLMIYKDRDITIQELDYLIEWIAE
jgi:hypothetical protein